MTLLSRSPPSSSPSPSTPKRRLSMGLSSIIKSSPLAAVAGNSEKDRAPEGADADDTE